MGLSLLPGCRASEAKPLKPARADLSVLIRQHPGYAQLEAVQGEIAALRRAVPSLAVGFPLGPAVLEPPPAVAAAPGPDAQRTAALVIEAELRLVERQLRRDAERRLAREADGIEDTARQAVAAERPRLQGALDERLREIERRYRAPETNLLLQVQAAERRLEQRALAAGEQTQAELERAAAQADLQALRERKQAEMDAARRETGAALDSFAAAREKEAAQALAAAKQRTEREIAQALGKEREALRREAAAPVARIAPVQPAAALSLDPLEGMAAPAPAAAARGEEVKRLEAVRERLDSMVNRETRAAAVLVGRRHGLEVRFEGAPGRAAANVTAQLAEWLEEYWRAGAEP